MNTSNISTKMNNQERGDIGKTLSKLVKCSIKVQNNITLNNLNDAKESLDEMILLVAPIYANYGGSLEFPPIIEAITMSVDYFNETFPDNKYTSQILNKYLQSIKRRNKYVRRT